MTKHYLAHLRDIESRNISPSCGVTAVMILHNDSTAKDGFPQTKWGILTIRQRKW